MANLDEFTALLKTTKPGDQLVIDYRRKDGAARDRRRSRLGKNQDRDYGFLGVGVLDAPWAPFTIDFNLANIGGPSAGLMFSLAVVDKLTTGDLNDGKFVAGTGTITGDGKVGPIGGITHKMSPPRRPARRCSWCPRTTATRPSPAHEDGLQLIKVENLDRGRSTRCTTYSAGGEPPRC